MSDNRFFGGRQLYVSALDFGLNESNTADDNKTALENAAVQAASIGSRLVYIHPGNYTVTAGASLGGVQLIGESVTIDGYNIQSATLAGAIIAADNFQRISPEVDDTGRLQRAIDTLRSRGGILLLSPVDYTISSALKFYSYVSVTGAGIAATKVINNGSGYAFQPNDPTALTRNATLGGFRISGTSSNAGGILAQNCNECVFENIEFGQVPNINLYLYGTLSGCYWNIVQRCNFLSNSTTSDCVKLDRDATAGHEPNANRILHNVMSGSNTGSTNGINIVRGDEVVVIGNGISDLVGLWIQNGGLYNQFISNRMENSVSSGGGFSHTATSTNSVSIANTVAGGDNTKWYTNSGSGNYRWMDRDPNGYQNVIGVSNPQGITTFSNSIIMSGGNNTMLRIPQSATAPTSNVGRGSVYFNTVTGKINVHNGTTWEAVTST